MTQVFARLVNARVNRSFGMWRASALFAKQCNNRISCALIGTPWGSGPGDEGRENSVCLSAPWNLSGHPVDSTRPCCQLWRDRGAGRIAASRAPGRPRVARVRRTPRLALASRGARGWLPRLRARQRRIHGTAPSLVARRRRDDGSSCRSASFWLATRPRCRAVGSARCLNPGAAATTSMNSP